MLALSLPPEIPDQVIVIAIVTLAGIFIAAWSKIRDAIRTAAGIKEHHQVDLSQPIEILPASRGATRDYVDGLNAAAERRLVSLEARSERIEARIAEIVEKNQRSGEARSAALHKRIDEILTAIGKLERAIGRAEATAAAAHIAPHLPT